jgi:hypothetical protein
MAYGLEILDSSGTIKEVSSNSVSGGILVEVIDVSTTVTINKVWPNIPGGYLFIVQIDVPSNPGYGITWTIYSDGNGKAAANIIPNTGSSACKAKLLVFATRVIEPSYGIECKNTAGDSIISAVYPAMQYTNNGNLVSPWTSLDGTLNQWAGGYKGYYVYLNSGGANPFYILPEVVASIAGDGNIYFVPTSGAASGLLYNLVGNTVSSSYLPSAIFYATTPVTGSDNYGIRMYDSNNVLTYDSGKQIVKLLSINSIYITPDVTGVTSGYTDTGISRSFAPAFMLPTVWAIAPGGTKFAWLGYRLFDNGTSTYWIETRFFPYSTGTGTISQILGNTGWVSVPVLDYISYGNGSYGPYHYFTY